MTSSARVAAWREARRRAGHTEVSLWLPDTLKAGLLQHAEQHGQPLTASILALLEATVALPVAETVAETPETDMPYSVSVAETVPETVPETYDARMYYLGKLCPAGHAYGATGKSLRRRRSHDCRLCHNLQKRVGRSKGEP